MVVGEGLAIVADVREALAGIVAEGLGADLVEDGVELGRGLLGPQNSYYYSFWYDTVTARIPTNSLYI